MSAFATPPPYSPGSDSVTYVYDKVVTVCSGL